MTETPKPNQKPHSGLTNLYEFTGNIVTKEDSATGFKVVTGDGILDKILESITEHIRVQFTNGQIRGEDYARVYTTLMQSGLQTALTIWLEKPSKDASELVMLEQAEGYKIDAGIKLLAQATDYQKTILNVTATIEGAPIIDQYNIDSVNNLVEDLKKRIKLTEYVVGEESMSREQIIDILDGNSSTYTIVDGYPKYAFSLSTDSNYKTTYNPALYNVRVWNILTPQGNIIEILDRVDDQGKRLEGSAIDVNKQGTTYTT